MARLLLADRVKGRNDSFLTPLIPALEQAHEVRFVSLGPGAALAEAIAWAEIVWLEWCWDHAVWATRSDVLRGRPCIVRLHSIEALQTEFPAQMDWSQVQRLVTVGEDIAALVRTRFPASAGVAAEIIPNGIDLARFAMAPLGRLDRYRVGWVGHVEPKKNPMLLLQIAHRLRQLDPRYGFHVAGAFTDLRTRRYLERMIPALGLGGAITLEGPVADMPAWYADKGVLLSTTMYESFGLNIGEAMAVGAFPVVHDFPGAEGLWPAECLFASLDQAVALIRASRPGLYRDWVGERYGLDRQAASVLAMIAEVAREPLAVAAA